uniref:Ovule protein n=1 Tax=Panagrellus redivivus TaxID=6233 RepID=A0A7E4ZS47_PANRE
MLNHLCCLSWEFKSARLSFDMSGTKDLTTNTVEAPTADKQVKVPSKDSKIPKKVVIASPLETADTSGDNNEEKQDSQK